MTDPVPVEEQPARILVVEDEEAIAHGLEVNLRRKGYTVEVALDGREALTRAGKERWDLILLDVRLPALDGFEVCRRLRDGGDFTPIVMLTARTQPDDVVQGLKLGADDYVAKPFDLEELLARIQGLLRRQAWLGDRRRDGELGEDGEPATGAEAEIGPVYRFGEFWVDFRSWRAGTREGEVELSRKELAVMKIFARREGQVITRRELLAEVWELPDHPNTRVVDNVIVALRKKFEDSSWRPKHIHSVRGVGYRFVP